MTDIRPADDGTTIDESEAEAVTHEPLPDAADLPTDVRDGQAGEDDPTIADQPPTTEE
jgi:hypothetical protein